MVFSSYCLSLLLLKGEPIDDFLDEDMADLIMCDHSKRLSDREYPAGGEACSWREIGELDDGSRGETWMGKAKDKLGEARAGLTPKTAGKNYAAPPGKNAQDLRERFKDKSVGQIFLNHCFPEEVSASDL